MKKLNVIIADARSLTSEDKEEAFKIADSTDESELYYTMRKALDFDWKDVAIKVAENESTEEATLDFLTRKAFEKNWADVVFKTALNENVDKPTRDFIYEEIERRMGQGDMSWMSFMTEIMTKYRLEDLPQGLLDIHVEESKDEEYARWLKKLAEDQGGTLSFGWFKKEYPSLERNEYIKNLFSKHGGKLTIEKIDKELSKHKEAIKPAKLQISEKVWNKKKQNPLKKEMTVLVLNMKPDVFEEYIMADRRMMQFWGALNQSSMISGHDFINMRSVGWVRLYEDTPDDESILVTEVQSDIISVFGPFRSTLKTKFSAQHIDYLENVINNLFPANEFYEQALQATIKWARANGYKNIHLVSPEQMKKITKSRSPSLTNLYDKLSKKFGFKGSEEVEGLDVRKRAVANIA